MAPTVESIEIARRPEDVFAYVTDPSRLPEWQRSVVAVRLEGDAPLAVGSRAVVTRRVGRREQAMTAELTELNSPSSWAVRGIDGPVRGIVKGTIEPLGDGERARVTQAARPARRSTAGVDGDAPEPAEAEGTARERCRRS